MLVTPHCLEVFLDLIWSCTSNFGSRREANILRDARENGDFGIIRGLVCNLFDSVGGKEV